MIFLDHFSFAPDYAEENFFMQQKRTCYDTYYPFQIFPDKGFRRIDFADITILYGGNGSGKSTALNLIANKIGAVHDAVYNRSNFFEDYLKYCSIDFEDKSFKEKEIITSDGVFDRMLDIRRLNQCIDDKREDTFDEYMSLKHRRYDEPFDEEMRKINLHPLENMSKLQKKNMANTKTQSQYVRRNLVDNVSEYSNGESAFEYFVHKIKNDGIYILDEPENSLCPERQLELVKFLEESVRYCNCQLIIATHSPFLLSMRGAKIYDLDACPVDIKKWTELGNVRTYFEFFMTHKDEFPREVVEQVKVKQKREKESSKARKILYSVLEQYKIDEETVGQIDFLLKNDKQIMDFIDYVACNLPAMKLGSKRMHDFMLAGAEGVR